MTEAPTIFITGATDGLGRALAGRLAADGASLILHGRDTGKLESTAAEIAAAHGVDHPRTVRADLSDLAQVRKLAQIMSGFELAGRVPAAEVTVSSLHPATYMPTKMVLQEIGHHIDSIGTGVSATRRLVSDPALAGVTGRFYDRTREARAAAQAYDASARAELWRRSLELTGHPGAG